jgi:cell division protein ZapA (FtsZ GTPase activity inhibitor)
LADQTKRVHVRIANVAYQLAATENENYIRQMAAKADEMIRRVQQNSPQLSQNMATVLALVNAMDEISQTSNQAEIAQRQRDSLERQLAETKVELSRMREQNWEMKKDMLKMQNLLAEFEHHLEKLKQSEIDTLGKPKPVVAVPEIIEDDDYENDENEEDGLLGEDFEPVDNLATQLIDTAPPSLQSYQQSCLEDFI